MPFAGAFERGGSWISGHPKEALILPDVRRATCFRLASAVQLCAGIVLGALLLIGCDDSTSPAPTSRETPPVEQPTPEPAQTPPTKLATPPAPASTAAPASSAFIQVAPGENHACGLQHDGQAHCWGPNDQGQLDVPSGAKFTQITSGWRFSCGLRTDGSITCWGRNNFNQADAPEGTFTSVDAGWDHACAVGRDGVTCWGREANGRTEAPRGVRFTAVGAGAEHSCGLTLSGDLTCWGRNDHGQAESRRGPFRALAVGLAHTCVLPMNGPSVCQGRDTADHASFTSTDIAYLTAGSLLTCGLLSTGTVECWEKASEAQAADQRPTPPGRFSSLSAGWHGVCGVHETGYSQCWGYTLSGAMFSPYFSSELSHSYLSISQHRRYDRLRLERVFSGDSFQHPIEAFSWPYGGIAVVDRSGVISVHTDGANPEPILDLTHKVDDSEGEKGMFSAALDPEFDEFQFLYIYYSLEGGAEEDERRARLARFPVVDGRAVQTEELVILDFPRPREIIRHYGGAIRFGPDGMLYLGVGDRQCLACPQELDNLYGKILRIDVRGATAEMPYRAPDDNPFVDIPDARPEVWAYGLRNPWRMAFDNTEGTLWVGDVGKSTQEEVSIVERGDNMGFPIFEGVDCVPVSKEPTEDERRVLAEYACGQLEGIRQPVVAYGRYYGCPPDAVCLRELGFHPPVVYGFPPRCAVVGGVVYRGAAMPWLDGVYLFGDFCSGQVWALDGDADSGWRMVQIADLSHSLASFGVDASGEVYVLTFGGPILRLVEGDPGPTGPTAAPGSA